MNYLIIIFAWSSSTFESYWQIV